MVHPADSRLARVAVLTGIDTEDGSDSSTSSTVTGQRTASPLCAGMVTLIVCDAAVGSSVKIRPVASSVTAASTGASVFIDHRTERSLVADGEESRRNRPNQGRFRGDNVYIILAYERIDGRRFGAQPPRRQIVRQVNGNSRLSCSVCCQARLPICRIAEILTHAVLPSSERRAAIQPTHRHHRHRHRTRPDWTVR